MFVYYFLATDVDGAENKAADRTAHVQQPDRQTIHPPTSEYMNCTFVSSF